jgi:hypothetical protein
MKEENRMSLKAKIYVENQKKTGHGKLAARLAFLNEKRLDGAAIQRDPAEPIKEVPGKKGKKEKKKEKKKEPPPASKAQE